jgi:hypothetical protein
VTVVVAAVAAIAVVMATAGTAEAAGIVVVAAVGNPVPPVGNVVVGIAVTGRLAPAGAGTTDGPPSGR